MARIERLIQMADVVLRPQAVIFDLDGVLVDSRAAVDATWIAWGARRGLAAELVLRTIPGMRTHDAVALLAPDSDIAREALQIVELEQRLVAEVTAIPGAAAILAQVPAACWGIATSGVERVARSRLAAVDLPQPEVFITADMVTRGKPDPEVYVRAAAALGVDPRACVVFEDAPSGVAAATAAGCTVVGVLTWAAPHMLATPYCVGDLLAIKVAVSAGAIELAFHNES